MLDISEQGAGMGIGDDQNVSAGPFGGGVAHFARFNEIYVSPLPDHSLKLLTTKTPRSFSIFVFACCASFCSHPTSTVLVLDLDLGLGLDRRRSACICRTTLPRAVRLAPRRLRESTRE